MSEKIFVAIITTSIMILISGIVTAIPVMWLWNSLVTSIFELRHISLLEAWGLSILTSLLFKPSYSSSKD